MMKLFHRTCAAGLAAFILSAGISGCAPQAQAPQVTSLTIWHYYNGVQQETFDRLVQQFNSTVGAEDGITVLAYNQGGISDVAEKSLAALADRTTETVPDLFAAYSDIAFEADKLGKLADLTPYFTEEELSAYLPAYLDEGTFDGSLKLFPIAKCTELLFLNETAWADFSAATGQTKSALTTWEGLAATAERYYQWTDSLTPLVSDDGKAFFGRDAFANYMLVGSAQLGTPLFDTDRSEGQTILADKATLHRLWENYFIPYVSGCFADYGRFRSDDLRTGDLICFVGSSSGAGYFPAEVTHADGTTSAIEGWISAPPNFEGTSPVAVQQGAGLVVTASTPSKEQAAAAFLKWFTAPEQNAAFAVSTSYLPVTTQGNTDEALDAAVSANSGAVHPFVRESLSMGIQISDTHRMYAPAPFLHESGARNVLTTHLPSAAKAGRAAVLALMAEGVSREDAVAQVASEEAFEQWFTSFEQALAPFQA